MLDYEKAYKEAIEKLRILQRSWSATQNRAAKEIAEAFSELREESEDERIVREILETLHYGLACEESVLMPGATTTLKEAIAYLERQKEQKPAINIEHLKSYMLQYLQDAANREDDSEIKADTDKWAKMIIKAFGGVEQKPAEWSEDIIRKAIEEVGLTQHQIDWFKNNVFPPKQEWSKEEKERIRQNGRLDVCYNPEKYGLCHKTEWGEGEMKALDSIIDDYETAAKSFCGHDGKIMFLKAIRDGEYGLSKQEWSEEDTCILEDAVTAVDLLGNDDEYSKTHPNLAKAFRAAKDWLKALPERFNLQPKQESEPIEIKYAGKIYKVYGTMELSGGVFGYIIEDEPGHYNCIIHPDEVLGGGYGIKSNGSSYPTKEITFDEQPAGWSEENEYTLGDAIRAVDMMLTDSFQDSHPNLFKALLIAKDFLKSLPERFNLPPKQEWSEKDKHRLQQAINALDRSGYPVLVDWFKSLPERFNLQPNWKPSEEQMWALDAALENFYHKDDRAALESLRTDLKNYFSHEIH